MYISELPFADFEKISQDEEELGGRWRYDGTLNIAAIRFYGRLHETVTATISRGICNALLDQPGVDETDFAPLGSTKYSVAGAMPGSRSSKEDGQAFTPATRRPNEADWPTFIIETGDAEGLAAIQNDASWWLTSSEEEVKIVLIVSINKCDKILLLKTWQLRGPTRATQVPTRTRCIEIVRSPTLPYQHSIATVHCTQYEVRGAPSLIGFETCTLSLPAPGQSDIAFDANFLATWADLVWTLKSECVEKEDGEWELKKNRCKKSRWKNSAIDVFNVE